MTEEQQTPEASEAPEVSAAAEAPPPPEVPLLELRDGLPPVVETPEALSATAAAVRAGTGPVAIDAERASGYRYSARAYLVQLRREGSGTALVDPIAFEDLSELQDAIGDSEWILHAATQDLPCLAEIGLVPSTLFDTELAGRLLGYPRVGLATLVETIVGRRMRKEHSAVDWSTRPLPAPWLEYAALDVEVLVELRDALAAELEETGKAEWARQEFEHLVTALPAGPRQDPWRRTSGLHRARGRRAVAAVRELWQARDEIASRRDVTPGRIIPDSAIVEAANALPRDKGTLLGIKGFNGRGAARYAAQWVEALRTARGLPEDELPPTGSRYDGPPPPRAWADRDPVAAARLTIARENLKERADELKLPVENMLTPDYVRRLLWEPPADKDDDDLPERVGQRLAEYGARPWQVELTRDILVTAIIEAADEA
ncbi:HRDC domain-containing protein [Nocardioides mesophilus]|uniref:Ribonuclease D n=1 Tax=Nocardioides mesophilus TaxID=433659 RepID=A0A7G9RA12_9ACTN|nr:HRDC domain-containing protein [Nocardioides mesophilus]QNN52437.1 ribonuclease D [Nocardioides mesophilus]